MLLGNSKSTVYSRSQKIGKTLLATAMLLGFSGVAAAQNMVVRSVGPSAKSFPTGKKITGGTKLTLKKLDKVTILGSSGTRILKGPGTFTIGSRTTQRTSASTRLSSFISTRGKGRAATGAVRSAGGNVPVTAPKNPSLWYLDINQTGKFCVHNTRALILWRPDYTGSATASIVEPISGAITKIEWSKSSTLKVWPRAAAPIASGLKYQLIGSNLPKTTEVDFVVLEAAPQNPDEAAAMLIANGCQGQLEMLVDKLETDSTAIEG